MNKNYVYHGNIKLDNVIIFEDKNKLSAKLDDSYNLEELQKSDSFRKMFCSAEKWQFYRASHLDWASPRFLEADITLAGEDIG